MNLSLYKLT